MRHGLHWLESVEQVLHGVLLLLAGLQCVDFFAQMACAVALKLRLVAVYAKHLRNVCVIQLVMHEWHKIAEGSHQVDDQNTYADEVATPHAAKVWQPAGKCKFADYANVNAPAI
ncbi:hypothetical protein D1627_01970 [Pontibacter oryzae]|uniref:Uncharacterized protein n=1 Tax=Pontibacter oryzae TaxID=2304593 RepID=A0A399SLJ3_9BACT|nr:hypothetical protein D1627_01970 [Pontibacter oryzae]